MISIVCVYNDEEILRDYLLKSLKNQTVEFELIRIDNTRNRFKSAAEALNYGGKKVKGNYIMFVHQDVNLTLNSCLENAEKILKSISNLGIAGVTGVVERKHILSLDWTRGRGVIKHGEPPEIPECFRPIRSPEKVQTLDECLIIIPRAVFKVLTFDEGVCNDWHLYAVDYCLSVRELGFDVYVIPMFIYHRSTGVSAKTCCQAILSLGLYPKEYYQTLESVLKKHKSCFKKIYTNCGNWSVLYPLTLQRVRQVIKKLLIDLLIRLGFRYLWRKSGLKHLWRQFQGRESAKSL